MDGAGFHFDSIWAFLLFVPLAILFLLRLRGYIGRQPSLRVASAKPYLAAAGGSWLPVRIPMLLEIVGCSCLIVALARPQFGTEEQQQRTQGIDIMLALDASGSMQSYDVEPHVKGQIGELIQLGKIKPRMDVAKAEVERFIDMRPNDRIGLLAFATHTFTICPPTLDHGFLKQHLRRLEAGKLGPSTNIAGPIGNATIRLKDSTARRRVLVLFSDGEETEEINLTPMQAAKIAAEFDVVLHTVGIGGGRTYQIDHQWRRLVTVRSSFNEKLMQDIAAETGGQYFKAAAQQGFREVMEAIDELETVEMEVPRYVDYQDLYQRWLQAGILFLIVGFALEYTLFLKVP